MKKKILLAVGLIFLSCQTVLSIDVNLVLDSRTETEFEKRVKSYLARELRSLGDVNIVDENETFRLGVVAVQNKASGKIIGYSISLVVYIRLSSEYLAENLSERGSLSKDQREFLNWLTAVGIYVPTGHILSTEGPDEESLRRLCSNLITTLDINTLEAHRSTSKQK